MMNKYNSEIDNSIIQKDIDRIINRIFKLLPSREEGTDWETPLQNLIIELVGLNELFKDQLDFLPLISKMEGLKMLGTEEDFLDFRRTIFECLTLLTGIKKCLD